MRSSQIMRATSIRFTHCALCCASMCILLACGDDAGDSGADSGAPQAGASASGGEGGTGGSGDAGGSGGSGGAGSGGSGGSGGSSGAGGGGAGGSGGSSGSGGSGGSGGDGGSSDPACALPAPIDEGFTWERTLHVAMDGSDDSGDGSEGSPFATIEGALAEVMPGTRVLVHAGTYGPFGADGLAGEEGSPIGIIADGEVTLEANGANAIIGMSDAAYVVIQGFTLTGAPVHGMNIDDGGSAQTPSHHIVLRDLTIPSAGSGDNNDCIKLSGVDDFWVLDSDIAGCDRGEIIDMVGCHRGVIAGNYFHDAIQNGVQAKGGSADTIIHGNRFENIPGRAVNAGGSTGLDFFRPIDAPHEAARITVVSNVCVRNGMEGGAAVAYVGCDGCVAAHNTIIEPRSWIIRILQESTDARFVPSREGVFVNNLIVLTPGDLRAELVNVGGGTAPETFTLGNNLWYAPSEDASWSPSLGGSVPAEVDSLVQMDPQLVDYEGGDYHLAAGSPAIGAARMLDGEPLADFDGRCFAASADIGAFAEP
jgi:hypothetical protein